MFLNRELCYRDSWRVLLIVVKDSFDFIIVHSPGKIDHRNYSPTKLMDAGWINYEFVLAFSINQTSNPLRQLSTQLHLQHSFPSDGCVGEEIIDKGHHSFVCMENEMSKWKEIVLSFSSSLWFDNEHTYFFHLKNILTFNDFSFVSQCDIKL